MRKHIAAALMVGALSALPLATLSAQGSQAKSQPHPKAASTAATHATQGVVKSVDDGMLVITRKDKSHGEMTFTLNSSTQREGAIAVGVPVSVRYHEDGKTNIATAVHVQQSKSAHKAPSSR